MPWLGLLSNQLEVLGRWVLVTTVLWLISVLVVTVKYRRRAAWAWLSTLMALPLPVWLTVQLYRWFDAFGRQTF